MSIKHPSSSEELILLPALTAHQGKKGELFLTRKYLEGVEEYAKSWPGHITSLVEVRAEPTTDMDHLKFAPDEWRTTIEVRPRAANEFAERIRRAALVFPFLCPGENNTHEICRSLGIPIVYGSEYTPRTEMQIIDAEVRNPLRRLRRKLWTVQAEKTRLRMLKDASGLQCSGIPCFDHYNNHIRNTLLFFDNRVRQTDVISIDAMSRKLARHATTPPLRLVFGGRLIAMKGVLQLPLVAAELRRLNIPFTLDIYGTGPLRETLAAATERLGLRNHVFLRAPLNFRDGWIPVLKKDADVFVCCHPQGDPSSTYPEVMSCGVPIAGYDNEAFLGIVRESGCGWTGPMNDPRELAKIIAKLATDRVSLAAAARRGREFALTHAFEPTFARRTDHLVALSRLPANMRRDYAHVRRSDSGGSSAA